MNIHMHTHYNTHHPQPYKMNYPGRDVAAPDPDENPYPVACPDPNQGVTTICGPCAIKMDGQGDELRANGYGQQIDDYIAHCTRKKHRKNMDARSGRVKACQDRGIQLMQVDLTAPVMLHHCLTCSLDEHGVPRHMYVDITAATIASHWNGRHHTRRVYDLRRGKYLARHAGHLHRFADEAW